MRLDGVTMLKVILFAVGIMFFSMPVKVYSQTKEELKKRKQKTEEEIKTTNILLEQTQKSQSTGLNKLLIIQKRINLREQLINEIEQEVNFLENDINVKTGSVIKLENDLKKLKEEYAKMIYFAYKNKNNYDRIMFILAAEDFNQAYRRMKYFQQYTQYRKKQARKIIETQKNLEYEIEQLKETKNEKINLLTKKENERKFLTEEKDKEGDEIQRLKRKEQQLAQKLKENERIKNLLEKAINELIAKEAAANKTYKSLNEKEEALSKSFEAAKGKIIWPIDNAIVLQEFGEHPHPLYKGVITKTEGIDIGVKKDTKVKAIFNGEVKKVVAIPGANMAVIIRHGHYLSFYSNIVNVRVKPGDYIKEGEYIGDIYTSGSEDSNPMLHLRIYKEMKVQNPRNWLRKL